MIISLLPMLSRPELGADENCCSYLLQQQDGCPTLCMDLSYNKGMESTRSLEARIIEAHQRLREAAVERNESTHIAQNAYTVVNPKLDNKLRTQRKVTDRSLLVAASKWSKAGSVSTAVTADTTSSASTSTRSTDWDADDEGESILGDYAEQTKRSILHESLPCVWGYFVDSVSPAPSPQPGPVLRKQMAPRFRNFLSKEIAATEHYERSVVPQEPQGKVLKRVAAQTDLSQ